MTRDYLLLQYVNFDGGLTGVRHGAPHSESRSQISLVPAVISFEGIIVIHLVPKIVVGASVTTVKRNIKPIAVPVVVKWNGIHNSKCFIDVCDVVC